MIIGNFKSFNDLNAKKNLQKQLLEVEANNELENQRRLQDFKNPYIPKPVPQIEKTSSELRKDLQFNESEARKNLGDFNMNYQDMSSIIIWLSNNNRLVDFNSNFRGIKKDIEANYNPKLVSAQWFENYLERYFEEVDINYGKKMEGNIELPLANNMQELENIIPNKNDIEGLKNLLKDIYDAKSGDMKELITKIIPLLDVYKEIILDDNLKDIINIKLNQKDRNTFIKRYITILRNMNFISLDELNEYFKHLSGVGLNEIGMIELLNRLYKQLFNINRDKDINNLITLLRNLDNNIKDMANTEINVEKIEEKISNLSDAKGVSVEEQNIKKKERDTFFKNLKQLKDNKTEKKTIIKLIEEEQDKLKEIITREKYNELITHVDNYVRGIKNLKIENKSREIIDVLINRFKEGSLDDYEDEISGKIFYDFNSLVRLLKIAVLEEYKNSIINNNKGLGEVYDPENSPTYTQIKSIGKNKKEIKYKHGFGLKDKMHKHFVEDEKMLRKVEKKLSDSSSDSEAEEELKRHIKATRKVDKTIEKKLGKGVMMDALASHQAKVAKDTYGFNAQDIRNTFGLGVDFKAKKIPVRKVGKGIEYEPLDNPTYREFGKYRLHIPRLVEKNIVDVRYPSLTSIPSIKPLLVTDDYKEFIVDIMKNGIMNEKHYRTLHPDERKHFERITSGAGLIHKFKITLNNEEEDLQDANRFNVLRGEYLAGNNNENMIKELRKLIVKFLNNGRISKAEGMNLLMELSI